APRHYLCDRGRPAVDIRLRDSGVVTAPEDEPACEPPDEGGDQDREGDLRRPTKQANVDAPSTPLRAVFQQELTHPCLRLHQRRKCRLPVRPWMTVPPLGL